MEILNREVVFNGQFLQIIAKTIKTKSGKTGLWETVARKNLHKRIVIIFALTKNKEVVLEKIFRAPIEGYVFELPAGLTDKEEESEADAAKRELLEETGYEAKEMIEVFTSVACPGAMQSEYVYFFAPDVELTNKIANEDEEEIEVFTLPLEKLVDFVMTKHNGVKMDDKILNILPILQKKFNLVF